jgi:hypothetical protein
MLVSAVLTTPTSSDRPILPTINAEHIISRIPFMIADFVMAFSASPAFFASLGN